MGEHHIAQAMSEEELQAFMRALLEDLAALERMIETGLIESGLRRIGAEQEMFLVDRQFRPAPIVMEVMEALGGHPQFTTELATFNLEANSNPLLYGGKCLSVLEKELNGLYRTAVGAAKKCNAKIALTGILPTITKDDLGLDNMTPKPRYYALNQAMARLRGGDFQTIIKGVDELQTSHDNVMLEACNTSFQLHFQVADDEFAKLYNVAQAVTAPVLAVAVNSPVLLGHRLWRETRIALFQQSVDARSTAHASRGGRPRVHFGDRWVRDGVIELFREDIARFRVVLATESGDPPLEMLRRGEIPKLAALCLHNGTVYRWNRPCYGVTDGKPHLRIENRVLPAGPTVLDEMANAAFFFGLMSGMLEEYGPIDKVMDFDDAKGNFVASARRGLAAEFNWINGETIAARELISSRLLPLAREGLRASGIDEHDIKRYLGVIEARVAGGRTGSDWALQSLAAMTREGGNQDERLRTLTAATISRQRRGQPVHAWSLASLSESGDWQSSFRTVGQLMDTDLFTVREHDIVDLAATLMEWEYVRYILVEDDGGQLVGLVSYAQLLKFVSRRFDKGDSPVTVGDIMLRDPPTATPATSTYEAIACMRESGMGCLPVVADGKLVGILTERHFMDVAQRLMDRTKKAN